MIDEEWLNINGGGQFVFVVDIEDKHGTEIFVVEDNELAADLMIRSLQIDAINEEEWKERGHVMPTFDMPIDQGERDSEIEKVSCILNEELNVYIRCRRFKVGTLSPIARLILEARRSADKDG